LERAGNSRTGADAALKQAADKGSVLAISEQIVYLASDVNGAPRPTPTRKILADALAAARVACSPPGGVVQRDFRLEEGLKWIDEWKRLSPGRTTPWVTEVPHAARIGSQ